MITKLLLDLIFGESFSLVKTQSAFTWHILLTSFDFILMNSNRSFLFGVWFLTSLHRRNLQKYILQRKQTIKHKQGKILFNLLQTKILKKQCLFKKKNRFKTSSSITLNFSQFFSVSCTAIPYALESCGLNKFKKKCLSWRNCSLGERERKRTSFVRKRFNDVYAFFETHRLMCKNLNWFIYIFGFNCQFFQITWVWSIL